MKLLVSVKRVLDANVSIRLKPDLSGVDQSNVKMAINPFDEIAVEEAIRLKESGIAEEIIAVSIGEKKCQETLRTALAMGADRAIHIETDSQLQPLEIAKILKVITLQEKPEIIIMGKQSIDSDNNQTGQMLAALLGWSQGTYASKIDIQQKQVLVTREVDDGLETLSLNLPAVITTDLRLNEPRYVKLPNIMKAKKKPLSTLTAESLGINLTTGIEILKIEEPAKRSAGIIVNDVQELVSKLKNEARDIL
ncbi:MAG: electron transfer flavoprotein subunit beta/FixA family protein [Gammaproteobacteria bacterium]|jgi:electron transfer flavoprotein beta subunit|nr:electron transfer flavoprotein subunit beta/FixA family protein [Gammaproteobacteria bacterium]MBT3725371.1 electron transfer flavoprotein subunit beta/FixA family protein [Gammaproteobacteria bacterium]MBT4078610.1 electron transfer flavoprotein subunit beta/FixA family protein [Gammaproteobacteria bacterium]MBT4194824.1 electron transfer flavoprotein subunit beta/FixA family protein [Gammaproteobacteria bacterium]MBT4451007.1 electron transfer flavoprotein subunit beta/FixA family protein 